MFTSTTDYIPDRKYEIIGIVTNPNFVTVFSKIIDPTVAIEKLVEEATKMKADGIIGIKPYTAANGATGVIGTAIKFIK